MSITANATDALSPLDGRYAAKLAPVREIFSEAGLMRERVRVECAWFAALARGPAARALSTLPPAARGWAEALAANPKETDVAAIKGIEARTKHDVKAVELWIRDGLEERGAAKAQLEWVHFACTSEDINNLAYALMLKEARTRLLVPALEALGAALDSLAVRYAAAGMLARTHGQSATPTTMGKELANIAARLERQRTALERVQVLAPGYQTYGEDFDINKPKMDFTIKLKRPQSQYSIYGGADKDSSTPPKQDAPPPDKNQKPN